MKILENSGQDFEIIDYLTSTPSPGELQSLAKKMSVRAKDFIRNKESVFKELDLKPHLDDEGLLFKHMSENPKLIERPIVVKGNTAVLGRPPELIETLINS